MAGEANKAIYRRFVEEVVNGGNFDIVDELYSPDYVDHAASSWRAAVALPASKP